MVPACCALLHRTQLHAAPRAHTSPLPAAGVDALGALLALALSGVPPLGMAAAAFAAILQHPELTAALTAAESVDEEQLEEQQQGAPAGASSAGPGDAAALLELYGVRPELAAAVAASPGSGGGDGGYFTGWALLMAHVLACPADSHGRRLLAQSVKDAHALVPALMDALVPLLPLESASGSRRRDSSGSSSASAPPASSAAAAAAAAPGGGGAAPAGSSFASQLVAAGPFPAGHGHGGEEELSPAEQQQAQRFAKILYAAVLQALPASARLWFADLRDRGTAAATERYTAAAVSGQLLAAELAAVTEVGAGQLCKWGLHQACIERPRCFAPHFRSRHFSLSTFPSPNPQAASAFGKFDKFSVRANATSREVIAGEESVSSMPGCSGPVHDRCCCPLSISPAGA